MAGPDPRQQVELWRQEGRFGEALALQREVMAESGTETEDHWRLGLLLFVTGAFGPAAQAFAEVLKARPDDPLIAENLGLSLLRVGRPKEGLSHLARALEASPDKINLLDGMAYGCGQTGDLKGAARYGRAVLEARDKAAVNRFPGYEPVPVPPFRPDRPEENVIAFCLFGDGARYHKGALRNAEAVPYLYPSWRARFYCADTLPVALPHGLEERGAEVVRLPEPGRFADALFWRFKVFEDPDVNRFLIRDADSVVNVRERVAVDEWLASDTHFHLMRDHHGHTDLVLAGMWGGVRGALPPLAEMLSHFSYAPGTESRTADQKFLREIAWPLIRKSCLIHDSLFRCFGSRDFPALGALPPGRHVGDIDHAFTKER